MIAVADGSPSVYLGQIEITSASAAASSAMAMEMLEDHESEELSDVAVLAAVDDETEPLEYQAAAPPTEANPLDVAIEQHETIEVEPELIDTNDVEVEPVVSRSFSFDDSLL